MTEALDNKDKLILAAWGQDFTRKDEPAPLAPVLPPEPEPVPEDFITVFENQKTGVRVVRLDVARYSEYLTRVFHIKYFNKTLYIYDDEKNLYRPQTNEIETHIKATRDSAGITEKQKTVADDVIANLKAMGCFTEYPFNTSQTDIPVENGIVRINYDDGTVQLLPHGAEHLFTYKLAVKYNPYARNCHAIALLERMVERQDIRTLVQIPAQALLQMQTGNAYKKAYLLQGEPHAGKTSFLKLLYRIFGDDFTAAISLQQLCENQFIGGTLEGKLLNIYDDLEDIALTVIDQFKTLTGDCRHGIERKFKDSYTGKISAVHVFTCNYPPEYPARVKRDAAFFERWEYLRFPFSYPVNPNFYEEWYTEERLSSYFNLIVSAMVTIRRGKLLKISNTEDVMMNWSVKADHLYEFIDWMFEPYNGTIPQNFSKSKLHNAYLEWCKDIAKIPEYKRHLSDKKFTNALQAHDIHPIRIRIGKERYHVYTTLAFHQRSKTPDLTPGDVGIDTYTE